MPPEEPKRGRGNPNMQRGAPSLNQKGRPPTTLAKRGQAPGSDGVVSHGGYLWGGEKKAGLTGSSRWVTYDNLHANVAAVASAVNVWLDLGGSVQWEAQENPRGGKDAAHCAELVQQGLIDARMTKPWRAVVKRQLMKKFRGFSMHAKGIKLDDAGRIVFSELAHRPHWTVERWNKVDETSPWHGVTQLTRMGKTFELARSDLFYSVEDAITDSPDGVGLFRHLVETERIFTRFRQLQGIAFDTDINGVPLVRAPLVELVKEARANNCTTDEAVAAYVNARTATIRDFAENRVVVSNRSLCLDSIPYMGLDTDGSERPSQVYQWSVETIKQLIGSIPELRAALGDLNREMLRVMCAEWMAMGDSEGARSVHVDKTQMFCLVINSALDDIADDATRDLAWWITARNGYDPEKCAPTMVHEPVNMRSALAAAQVLEAIAKAKLKPDDEAIDILRAREDLPPQPEPTEEEIARSRAAPEVVKPGDSKPAPADKPKKEKDPEPDDKDEE